jgi:N-acetylmuramoyl-L-alanine amidase
MDVPEFARPHVASATRHQLIINRPDVQQLRPNHAATRAEVAATVYQARVALQLAPAIASPYIVTPPRTNSTPAVPASPESQASSPQPSTPSFSPSQPASIPTAAPAAAPKVNSWQSDPASPNPDSKSDSESDSNLKQPPASASSTTANPQSVIILDPGHGGDDIGAISKTGLQEKSVVLDIAQRTAQQLQQQISVILTRDRDQTLSLSDRVQQIQQHIQQQNVIALISLHTNAISLNHPQINGLETYYYPGRQAAADLAAAIHQHILQQTSYRDRGIRQANYHILREINLPAIVVELGFITGADDAPKLARANHRQQLADAISQGVYRFLEQQHFASNSSSSAR